MLLPEDAFLFELELEAPTRDAWLPRPELVLDAVCALADSLRAAPPATPTDTEGAAAGRVEWAAEVGARDWVWRD